MRLAAGIQPSAPWAHGRPEWASWGPDGRSGVQLQEVAATGGLVGDVVAIFRAPGVPAWFNMPSVDFVVWA